MLRLLLALASFALLGGCAAYQMGSPGALDFKTVYVRPVTIDADLPELDQALARALRKEIEASANIRLAPSDQADATLEVKVTQARRETVAVSRSDVGRGRKFELHLSFVVNLRDNRQPDAYLIQERALSLRQDVYVDQGQTDAERQAGPEIARKASQMIVETIGESW